MQRLQAFKYELMPTGDQQRDMRRFAGSCRFVFNKALALQQERYEQGESRLGYAGLCKLLTQWRNGTETPWLKEAPTHPLQQALKDLERAYANFFAKRAELPRFNKRKGQGDSFRYPDPKQIKLDPANTAILILAPLATMGCVYEVIYHNRLTKNGQIENCCGQQPHLPAQDGLAALP